MKEMSFLKVLCKVYLKPPGSKENCDFMQLHDPKKPLLRYTRCI